MGRSFEILIKYWYNIGRNIQNEYYINAQMVEPFNIGICLNNTRTVGYQIILLGLSKENCFKLT